MFYVCSFSQDLKVNLKFKHFGTTFLSNSRNKHSHTLSNEIFYPEFEVNESSFTSLRV